MASQAIINFKLLAIGLGLCLLTYASLFIYVLTNGDSYIESVEKSAPKITTTIEKKVPAHGDMLTANDHAMPSMDGGHQAPAIEQKPEKPFAIGLFEKTEFGMVPREIMNPQDTIFQTYKKPYAIAPDKKMVAILLTGFGLSHELSTMALTQLPKNVTLSINPYSQDIHTWSKTLRKTDREFWLTLPMEDENYPLSDPGPKALFSRSTDFQNLNNILWVLSRDYGYTGVIGYADNAFAVAKTMLASMLENLFNRGVAYFESNPEAPFYHDLYAEKLQGKYKQSFIAPKNSNFLSIMDTINAELKNGQVLTITLPLTPANIMQIKTWAENLPEDTELAPLSAAYATY